MNLFHASVIVTWLVAMGYTNAQVLECGPCSTPAVQPNLDYARFAGQWFENRRFPNEFEDDLDCVTMSLSLSREIGNISMTIRGTDGGIPRIANIKGDRPNRDDPAKFRVQLPGVAGLVPYYVMSTDYSQYAVLYACQELEGRTNHYDFIWILTRAKPHLQPLDPNIVDEIYAKLEKCDINTAHFQLTSSC